MQWTYSIRDNTITWIRFLDGVLQTSYSTTYYEDWKAICLWVDWVDVPVTNSSNFISQ